MSSIEWLIDQLQKTDKGKNFLEQSYNKGIIEQAKEMHRKEIIDAYQSGQILVELNAKDYYTETFTDTNKKA